MGPAFSTLYNQAGMANALIVTIPGRDKAHGGTPTGVVFNSTPFFSGHKKWKFKAGPVHLCQRGWYHLRMESGAGRDQRHPRLQSEGRQRL